MNNTTEIHPDVVVDAIFATTVHPAKRRNLEVIHQVCKERHDLGSTDFTLKSVGNAVEARGGLKTKVLWNEQSADYRKLIEAWQAYAGGGRKPREIAKISSQEALVRTITDPATRIIVEKLIRERNSLKAEINILKSQSTVTIDRRPKTSTSSAPGVSNCDMTLEIQAGPTLNPVEKEALEYALSRDLWEAEGWAEDKYGRVVKGSTATGRSRAIFKPGFVTAIRKILGVF